MRPIGDAGHGARVVARPTGIDELDRVLGGGFVPGSVTLVGGEPGIGKSTLLLQTLAPVAARGARALAGVGRRVGAAGPAARRRLGADQPDLWLASETELPRILAAASEVMPELLVVDSMQAIADPEAGSRPAPWCRSAAARRHSSSSPSTQGISVVLVGHVTKDGSLAGPRTLEHLVDTVLSFEGERHHALRMLRAVKHRFGATGELGLFEMGEVGLVGVPDPERLVPRRPPGRTCRDPSWCRRWKVTARCWSRFRRW